jgi:hypothetical protein
MPAFLAPLIGAAGGLVLGYIIDHTLGDSDYSAKEAFVDASTGAVGGGLIGPVMRVGSRSNKVIRHSAHRGYTAGAGVTESLLLAGYVTKPMISRPARMELLAGTVASLVYDIATRQSPDVRSERNASDVTSGGTSLGSELVKPAFGSRYKMRKEWGGPCPSGYGLHQIKGKFGQRWMCVRKDKYKKFLG